MTLPLHPPIEPMLAKLAKEIPTGDDWLYEPKWDGFRALAFRDGAAMEVISRDGRSLNRYFPELIELLDGALAEDCVVDGEVVVTGADGFDFDALLQRIHPAESRVQLLARETPSGFIAFDALARGSEDLTTHPLEERRRALDELFAEAVVAATPEDVFASLARVPSSVVMTPQTSDVDVAESWLTEFDAQGLDGVVAKRRDGDYQPGKRTMMKIKQVRTADCVVGGYRYSKKGDGVGSLLLGLYDDDGNLHYVGHTSAFKAAERRELLEKLRPLEGGTSFAGGRVPGAESRWTAGKDKSWVSLEPTLVCEVSFDRLLSGRFRHAAGFVRWRPDKPPRECTFDQAG
jgi:ATP-dependent DNA ligase